MNAHALQIKSTPNIDNTIALLRQIIQDPFCMRMNLSNVKGYLGELLVKAMLEDEGCVVTQKGNQCGYDLEYLVHGDAIKIDVKFSNGITNWGWSVVPGSKKKPISCTHFVCVAVGNDFLVRKYYVISKTNHTLLPAATGRFNATHGFIVFPDEYLPQSATPRYELFSRCNDLLSDGKIVAVNPRQSISEAIAALG